MNDLIFGYKWEEIQEMQRGTYRRKTIPILSPKKGANTDDLTLLAKHGEQGLEKLGLFGVLDRLRTSGKL